MILLFPIYIAWIAFGVTTFIYDPVWVRIAWCIVTVAYIVFMILHTRKQKEFEPVQTNQTNNPTTQQTTKEQK